MYIPFDAIGRGINRARIPVQQHLSTDTKAIVAGQMQDNAETLYRTMHQS